MKSKSILSIAITAALLSTALLSSTSALAAEFYQSAAACSAPSNMTFSGLTIGFGQGISNVNLYNPGTVDCPVPVALGLLTDATVVVRDNNAKDMVYATVIIHDADGQYRFISRKNAAVSDGGVGSVSWTGVAQLSLQPAIAEAVAANHRGFPLIEIRLPSIDDANFQRSTFVGIIYSY